MSTRRALVVANDEYDDTGLQSLRSPVTDAAALADVLGDPDIGQFELSVVRNATVQELREKLDTFFGSAGRADELLVHFSCHGLKDDANDLYLAASDTRLGLLASTGLAADFVARRMRASRARSVALLLDCCYGGAFERGMLARASGEVSVLDSFEPGQLADGHGRVVITASSAVEYAFEGDDLTDDGGTQPSVFTAAIVKGIASGEADTAGTGRINIHELFAYAEEQVRRTNPRQTPHLWSFGTRGDILVARTPLRRVTPAALPVPVQTALAGDRISRLGAVHELSLLLDRDDPSLVLAAVQALGFLVDDDSRSLSEAAATALRRVDLTATPSSVEVAAGEQAEVELGGSALGVAARVVSAPEWAHVRQIGIRLLITPSPAETSTGTISIDGPTGLAQVDLTATVPTPEPEPTPQSTPDSAATTEPTIEPTAERAAPITDPTASAAGSTAPRANPEVTAGPVTELAADSTGRSSAETTAETTASGAGEAESGATKPASGVGSEAEADKADSARIHGVLSSIQASVAGEETVGRSGAEPRRTLTSAITEAERARRERIVRRLWAAGAAGTLLCLVMPMDSDGPDLIWSRDYAGDNTLGAAILWTLFILAAAAALIVGALRWYAGRRALIVGVAGTLATIVAGIFAGYAAGTDGATVGTVIGAIVAPLLAIAGTGLAIVNNRTITRRS